MTILPESDNSRGSFEGSQHESRRACSKIEIMLVRIRCIAIDPIMRAFQQNNFYRRLGHFINILLVKLRINLLTQFSIMAKITSTKTCVISSKGLS